MVYTVAENTSDSRMESPLVRSSSRLTIEICSFIHAIEDGRSAYHTLWLMTSLSSEVAQSHSIAISLLLELWSDNQELCPRNDVFG